jgi:hypothetical protein
MGSGRMSVAVHGAEAAKAMSITTERLEEGPRLMGEPAAIAEEGDSALEGHSEGGATQVAETRVCLYAAAALAIPILASHKAVLDLSPIPKLQRTNPLLPVMLAARQEGLPDKHLCSSEHPTTPDLVEVGSGQATEAGVHLDAERTRQGQRERFVGAQKAFLRVQWRPLEKGEYSEW